MNTYQFAVSGPLEADDVQADEFLDAVRDQLHELGCRPGLCGRTRNGDRFAFNFLAEADSTDTAARRGHHLFGAALRGAWAETRIALVPDTATQTLVEE